MKNLWEEVDLYLGEMLAPSDSVLDATLAANRAAGLPEIDVSRLQGKFLDVLVRISGAKRVLEIGTLGGYSTVWLARAIGASGRVVTLEVNASYADVARSNFRRAGLLEHIELRVGRATDTLPLLHQEGTAPFDFIFIDADKPNNPVYLEWALKLSRTGTVIIFDNVVRDGNVIDPDSSDANVLGVRECITMLKAHPRLSATALQTVGAKGYDGFALAVVTS